MRAPGPGAERRRGTPAPQSGLPARRAALALLDGVLIAHRPLDELLAADAGALAGLEPRDRAFARLLAATVLRRLGQIDAALAAWLERPLSPRAAQARLLLRLGAAQMLFLGTPAHAAVGSTVALAGAANATRPFKGLLNAVLRRAAREGEVLTAAQDAARLNTPGWLWESWARAHGAAATEAIAAAHLAEPPLDLTLCPGLDVQDWAARLEAEILPTGSLRRPAGGAIETLPGFADGAWWVQDAAAALPARLLPNLSGRNVLDLCAAPGGKAVQLAAAGARVTALDRSAKRMGLVRQNLARLGLDAECVVADAAEWRAPGPADAILLDAPCSATGTIRRHPDVARLKRPQDLPALVALQDRLLDNAAAQLASGGVLVYCTCSLQPEEGPERIAALLGRNPGLRRAPVLPGELPGADFALTPEGDLRTLPCHFSAIGGVDGFYAARLTRI